MKQARIQGTIALAGDKSLSHRAVMFAALVKGKSRLRNLSHGVDVATTRAIIRDLGASFENTKEGLIITSAGFHYLSSTQDSLYCGNSGTTLRLILGILAGSKVRCQLSGDSSLNKRPVNRVINPLNLMGGLLRTVNGSDAPPVIVEGTPLRGISYSSSVSSAQVKSAVLLAGIHASGETQYSEPTRSRDHTERFLAVQGADIGISGMTVTLKPPVKLRAFEYDVPGDISTAMFFIVGTLLTHGSDLTIKNVLLNETRTGALDILRNMGANIVTENQRVENGEPVGDIHVRESSLEGIDTARYETARFIDEIPILSVAAMFATGTTVFHNIGELRVKESDRAQGIVNVLASYGCTSSLTGNDLVVEGSTLGATATPLHHGDHRLAMAIEIIELILNGQVKGEYEDVVAISAPEFYETLKSVLQ